MSSVHLSTGRLNIGLIQEQARKQLLCLLEKCDGPKAIIWDESLGGPMGLVAKYDILQEHEVTKMYPLVGGRLPSADVANVIFITRPHLDLMDLIAQNIHGEEGNRHRKEFHIFFVPRKSLLCEKKLQNRGVYGNFTLVEEFSCDLFPFDNDLVSMELPNAYREFYLENDPTCLYQVAQAIQSMQKLYGKISKVTGRGPAASKVWDLMKRLSREEEDSKINNLQAPAIEHLLLLDRSVDLLSPLVTQLTYEGLIDEIFGINNTTVKLPAEKFANSEESPTVMSLERKKQQIILNSSEELFAEIRDKNFNGVGPVLSRKAKVISSEFDERHGDKSVQEIKQFVARLPHMIATKASLAKHTTIAEMIKEVTDSSDFLEVLQIEQELLNCIDTDKPNSYIEDLIAQQQPLMKVLRLLCIQSITNSGLKQKLLDYYKREIIQTYGYQHLPTLLNLEKVGLLKVQQSVRQYAVLRKALRLTVEDESEIAPKDISYVHSIYAPLSVRLAEQLVQPGGWQGLNDILGLLPGPAISSVSQNSMPTGRRNSITSEDSTSEPPKLVLVFFIGGCTYAEISALRFLSQQEDSNVEFVVGTTRLINGNTFLFSLVEEMKQN
ncbi:vacuolar protein sorting-associated protein 33A isoform X1 [Phymastichus coffea]|uniref:vacuolar protein sorting-associated protein 33A isoform X1 n=2 Tax=Phymastichus coffea TaxID=108790 RepID=UPI00273C9F37|nr:vacuolar protein sorting-associated protein 33A isoform X1 [Phymastichus coffea]XP_058789342.1 vacuolar protein sorting-associated protein 33A isoform X1 [Phymastichus coffea]